MYGTRRKRRHANYHYFYSIGIFKTEFIPSPSASIPFLPLVALKDKTIFIQTLKGIRAAVGNTRESHCKPVIYVIGEFIPTRSKNAFTGQIQRLTDGSKRPLPHYKNERTLQFDRIKRQQ